MYVYRINLCISLKRFSNFSMLLNPTAEVGHACVHGGIVGTAPSGAPWCHTHQLPASAHLASEWAAAVAIAGATLAALTHTDMVLADVAAPGLLAMGLGVDVDVCFLQDVRHRSSPAGSAPSSNPTVAVAGKVLVAVGKSHGTGILTTEVSGWRQLDEGDVIGVARFPVRIRWMLDDTAHRVTFGLALTLRVAVVQTNDDAIATGWCGHAVSGCQHPLGTQDRDTAEVAVVALQGRLPWPFAGLADVITANDKGQPRRNCRKQDRSEEE